MSQKTNQTTSHSKQRKLPFGSNPSPRALVTSPGIVKPEETGRAGRGLQVKSQALSPGASYTGHTQTFLWTLPVTHPWLSGRFCQAAAGTQGQQPRSGPGSAALCGESVLARAIDSKTSRFRVPKMINLSVSSFFLYIEKILHRPKVTLNF